MSTFCASSCPLNPAHRCKGKGIMKHTTKNVFAEQRSYFKPVTGYSIRFVGCLAVLLLMLGAVRAQADWPHVVPSKDGTPISYEIHGAGEPTLVFVHGWGCDARYWSAQLPYFSKKHRVVTLDLAGARPLGYVTSRVYRESFRRRCTSRDRGDRQSRRHPDRAFHGRHRDCRGRPTHA